MGLLSNSIFGIRLWIFAYFLLSILLFLGVLIYIKREAIRKKYYEIRFPEKLLKCIVHHKGGLYKVYWRLIPDHDYFIFHSKQYLFDNKAVMKDHDFYLRKGKYNWFFEIDGIKYDFIKHFNVKEKKYKYPEIHYFYQKPLPINFDMSKKQIEFTSKQLQEFKDNDLFTKLLTLQTERQMMTLIIILIVVNVLINFVLLAKNMGWIK